MAVALDKKQLTIAALLIACVLVLVSLAYLPMSNPSNLATAKVQIGSTEIEVELATTPEERTLGLGGRAVLPEGKGMLFVFESAGAHGIWMKDMRFPIDIVWADQDGRIISIEENVSPATYPESFYPESPAMYVLELPAGFAKRHGIGFGAQIVVK